MLPLQTAPAVGTGVRFELSDVGRVALKDSLGPEVDQVDGVIVQQDPTAYLISVSRVGYLRGTEGKWNNERVTIARSAVGRSYERRFDRFRSTLAGVAAVGVIALFIASRSILGSASDPINNNPGGGGPPPGT